MNYECHVSTHDYGNADDQHHHKHPQDTDAVSHYGFGGEDVVDMDTGADAIDDQNYAAAAADAAAGAYCPKAVNARTDSYVRSARPVNSTTAGVGYLPWLSDRWCMQ